jgi:hypothetical protein
MKACRGEEVQLQVFLTLTLEGDEVAGSHTSRFTPGVVALVIRGIGGWVDLTGSLEI